MDVRAAEVGMLIERRHPDVIVHLASAGPRSEMSREWSVVTGGAVNLLEAACRHGVGRIVVAPSAHLYDDGTGALINEQQLRAPRRLTAAAYIAALELAATYRALHGIEFVGLVAANVYGGRDREGVVAELTRCRRNGTPFTLHGTGHQTRDFVHVDDVVDALVRALARGTGVTVNVGTGIGTGIGDLADRAGVKVTKGPARVGSRTRVALDPARAKLYLGWEPFTSLDDGLRAEWSARS